jgi:hypothetical protein
MWLDNGVLTAAKAIMFTHIVLIFKHTSVPFYANLFNFLEN